MTKPDDVPALTEPRIVRGKIPGIARTAGRKVGKSPFTRHRELAIQFPPVYDEATGEYSGGWIECGRAQRKGDGPKARNRIILNLKWRLNRWLAEYHPLERYEVAIRTEQSYPRGRDPSAETPAHSKAMYFRFLGTVSEEQHQLDLKAKRAHYEFLMRRRKEKAAERELERRRQETGQG